MVNIEALITAIVKPLLDHPEDFGVEQVETDDFMEYHLHLNPQDVDRVIGKKSLSSGYEQSPITNSSGPSKA